MPQTGCVTLSVPHFSPRKGRQRFGKAEMDHAKRTVIANPTAHSYRARREIRILSRAESLIKTAQLLVELAPDHQMTAVDVLPFGPARESKPVPLDRAGVVGDADSGTG